MDDLRSPEEREEDAQEREDLREERKANRPHPGGRPVYSHGPIVRSLFIAYIITNGIVIFLGGWQWYDVNRQADTIHQQCLDNADNRERIRNTFIRSLTQLGYSWNEEKQTPYQVGPPSTAYYREHPSEVAVAVDRIRLQIEGFPPIKCDKE